MNRLFHATLALLALATSSAFGQSTWINPLGGNWSVATNWDPIGVPSSGPTTTLNFNSFFGAAFTATNDTGVLPFQLQTLNLNSHSLGLMTITTSGTNSLEFVANSSINVLGGSTTIAGNPTNLLGVTNIGGNGWGTLTISSQLIGASGSLNIQRTTSNYLGLTALTSATANTFGGGVTLTSGILSTSTATNFGPGTITIATTGVGLLANGEFRTSATVTFNNPFTINSGATFNVSTGSTYVIGSAIGGQGGFNIGNYILSNAITLEGANSFSGAVTNQFGTLTLRGNNGALASNSLAFFRNSSLTLDSNTATTGTGNTAGNEISQNRIPDSATVTLNRSNFNMTANAAASTTETVGVINNTGWGIFSLTTQTATGLTLTINNLNRIANGTFEFRGGNLGLNPPGTANSANVIIGNINGSPAASSLVGGGTPGTPRVSIFPFMTGSNAPATNGNTFLTYDGLNGVRLLDAVTEYSAQLQPAAYFNPTAQDNNVRPTVALLVATQAGNTPIQMNSLAINGANAGIYGFGGLAGHINLRSSALLNVTSTGYIGTQELGFEGGLGFITMNGTLIIDSRIVNNSGLAISGVNRVSLNNDANTISGPIVINFGTLQVNNQAQLGGAPQINFHGGFLDAGSLATGTPDTFTTNMNFGPAGGIIRVKPLGNNANGTGQSMLITGALSGTGPFQVNSTGTRAISGGGTLILAGDASAYSGLVMIDGGTLQIDSDARLGSNPFLSLGSTSTTVPAKLAVTGTTVTNKNIMVNGLGFIEVAAGSVFTVNGYMTGTQAGAALNKLGSGELILTNEANYAGATELGNVSLNFQNFGGTLRLAAQGAIVNTSAFTINQGSSLVLDNGAVYIPNRINSAPVNLAGGTLQMRGRAGVTATEITGQLTTNVNTGSIIEVLAAGSPTEIYFSGTTNGGFTRGAGSTLTVSGNGLGTLSQINIIHNVAAPTGPALTNGILPFVFGENSGSIAHVTVDTIAATPTFPQFYRTRLLALSDYTTDAFPDTGVSTANHRLTLPAAPTGSSTVNSLFLDSGGSLTIGTGNVSSITTGTIIMANGTSITGGTLSRAASGDIGIYVNGTAILASAVNTLGTANSLIKAGPGDLEIGASLGTTNTPLNYNISRGTLRMATGVTLPTNAVLNVAAGATYDHNGNGSTAAVAAINGLGTVNLGSTTGTVLQIGTGTATSLFGGTITGIGSIEKIGTGTLRFTATSNYTGPIALTAGTLAYGNASGDSQRYPIVTGGVITAADGTTISVQAVEDFARPINVNVGTSTGTVTLNMFGGFGGNTRFSGDIFIAANKTLAFGASTSGFSRLSGNISGDGNVTMISVINTIIDGNNTYTGTTTVTTTSPSFLGIASNTAFGNGGTVTFNAANLVAVGGNRTITNPVNLNGNITYGTSLSIYQGDNLTFTGNAVMNANRTFTTVASGRITFTNVAGAFTVTKAGGGTLAFQGTNISYSGVTTVNAGTFLANGVFTAGGTVTINAAAALGGTGTLNRNVAISALGTIAPGESAGNLTINSDLTFAAGGIYYWELASNTTSGGGSNWDRISMTSGNLTVPAGAVLIPAFIDAASSPDSSPFWSVTQRWNNIIDLTGTATNTSGGVTFNIDNSAWTAFGTFNTELAQIGSGIDLVWTPIPEPAGLLALAAICIAVRRRRQVGSCD